MVMLILGTWIWIGPYEYEYEILDGSMYSRESLIHYIVEFPPGAHSKSVEIDIIALEGSIDIYVMSAADYYKMKKNESYDAILETLNSQCVVESIQIGEEWRIFIGWAGHDGDIGISGKIVVKCWVYTTAVESGWWTRV